MNIQKLQNIKAKYLELTSQISDPKVISNNKEWTALSKEQSLLEPIVDAFDNYLKANNDLNGALKLLKTEKDAQMVELVELEIEEKRALVEELTNQLKILLLPADPNDEKDVIMEIRAGAGGDEAGLFGAVLMRMYKMYAAANRWNVEDIDVGFTEIGGIKEVTFQIKGKGVYSKLKFESGVHRVQRVPETETQGRVHTSTVTVAVLPEAEEVTVDINEKDLKVDTYRSGGAGGQHVNKTESAIRITHIPTGIIVQCQDERSQIKNRDKAMRVLRSKLYDLSRIEAEKNMAAERKAQVGTGDRSERIRTYNYSQGRVSDHRIGMTVYTLDDFVNGQIGAMVEALRLADQTAKLESEK
ncbi:MAG: peptide chain release factor 1 [Firmicutes bacterium]|nr:peptide chain release factor 1 [Bacillota bacterium]